MIAKLDIAASTWSRIRSVGTFSTPGIMGRATSVYRDIQYNRLTREGFSPDLARRFKSAGPEKVDELIGKMSELVSIIVSKNEVPDYPGFTAAQAVKRAMRLSDKEWSELDKNIREAWY
jgi:hypothetical protein